MINIRTIGSLILLFLVVASGPSCRKFLNVPPPKDQLVHDEVFDNDNSAIAALVGIYGEMMLLEQVFSGTMTIDCGLYADELDNNQPGNQFVQSALTSDNTDVSNSWALMYNYIYGANAVIEGVAGSSSVTPATKNQLTGEAKFIRAFSHFYLVNLFGDVPLITSTDYTGNSVIGRTPADTVYQQIISDLKDAQNLLPADYSVSGGEKVRPNKWAATALLARVYLYTGDWADAEAQATAVIESNVFTPLPALSGAFLKNNTEAIWQLMPVATDYNTFEGQYLIPYSTSSLPNYWLTGALVNSIETGDQRMTSWMGSLTVGGQLYYYPYKYKVQTGSVLTEYYTVLRVAEQYLIRAEARAEQNKTADAIGDVNVIRTRAGLSPLSASLDEGQVLAAIAHERQVELFAEWGHRWFDLKRTAQANMVIGALKPGSWKPTGVLWPIPVTQLKANQELTQNAGY